MGENAYASIRPLEFSACDTLPKHFMRNYLTYKGSGKESMRFKDRGIWKTYTWDDCFEKVRYLSLGLAHLGFKRGHKVGILGENNPEWYWGQIAVQALGGVVVGLFTDCIPKEARYFIEDSDTIFMIVHDQEQVDKILEIRDDVSALTYVIYWEEKGLWNYTQDFLLSFDDVIEFGRKFEKDNPHFFEESVSLGRSDDTGVICYTSGTTGDPRGAMLSQRYLTRVDWAKVDDWNQCSRYVSFVPPAWAVEQVIGFKSWLMHGVLIYFPEKPETVQNDIREIGPDLLFYGARLWENVNRNVQAKIADTSGPRRFIYRKGMGVALKMADLKINNRTPGKIMRFGYWIVFQLLLRQLRDRLGLSNADIVYSAGGGLSPEIVKYFLALGVEIRLFYGATESGVVSLPRKGQIRPESSGIIVPWAQVKLSEEGEILLKSEAMFTGYYNRPDDTEKAYKDGWYQTGDFGYLTKDGHLIVIDRMDDLKPLGSRGKKFSPQYIEIRLRFSPFIKDTLVVGLHGKEIVGALVNIDLENTGRFAESKGIPYTTFTDLSQRPEVIELIKGEIQKINRDLPVGSRLKRFLNFPKELDADEAELTRTMKLRRGYVETSYSGMIDALFGDKEKYFFKTIVSYRDGKKGDITTYVSINIIE